MDIPKTELIIENEIRVQGISFPSTLIVILTEVVFDRVTSKEVYNVYFNASLIG